MPHLLPLDAYAPCGLSLVPVTTHPAHCSPHRAWLGMFLGRRGLSGYEQCKAFIDQLREYATSEPFVYRHTWRRDELVIWDNRQVR